MGPVIVIVDTSKVKIISGTSQIYVEPKDIKDLIKQLVWAMERVQGD